MNGINQGRADAGLSSHTDSLGPLIEPCPRGRENIVSENPGIGVIGDVIPAIDGVLCALQPVSAADVLIFVARAWGRVNQPPARIAGNGNIFQQPERGSAKQACWYLIIGEGLPSAGILQADRPVVRLAGRRLDRAEIPVENLLRGHEANGLGRRGPRARRLETAEQKYLVPSDRSAEGASALVPA